MSLYRPEFRSEWRRMPLWDVARWTNGLAFRSIHFSETGDPIIKIAELKNGINHQTGFTQQKFEEKYWVSPGDILYSWSGSPQTSLDVFVWEGPSGWLNQHIFKVEALPGIDKVYLVQLLRYLRPNLVAIATNKQTTGLGHVTQRDMRRITVGIPPIDEQRRIARVLGSLDDKISLNRKLNQTLEEMAQALFKSWFIDFDGHTDLVESELGPIPRGWEVGTIADVADNIRDTVGPDDVPPEMPYVGLNHVPRRNAALEEWGRASEVMSTKARFRQGDTLFGKLRPYFHKVVPAPIDGVCTTEILVIRPKSASWRWFSFGHLFSEAMVSHASAAANGTRMPRVSWKDLCQLKFALPPESVASQYSDLAAPLFDRIHANAQESRALSSLRDTLLPRLVSGSFRLPHTEEMTEAAS